MPEYDDTIIKSDGVYTIAVTTQLGPAVPYPAVRHEDGDNNNGFVNLAEYPEVIDQIAELQGRPGFTELIRAINHPNSELMTLGCEVGLFQVDNPAADGPTCYVGNYVDIAYRDFTLATEENLIKLAKTIIEVRKPVEAEWTSYELVVQKMRHFFGQPGSNLMLKILSYGRIELHPVLLTPA